MKPGTSGGGVPAAGAAAVNEAVSELDADMEIVPSGAALSIVSGWLGMSREEALVEAGPNAAAQAPVPSRRPQFLGLGAKFLPHHKAVETATALDAKLRKRLERGLAARRAAAEDERGGAEQQQQRSNGTLMGGRTGFNAKGVPGMGSKGAREGAGRDGNEDSDEDEEDERKAAGRSRGPPGPGAGGPAALGKAAREALLYAPVGGGVRKKGKKKGKS